jgi:hypothetical protein
VQHIDGAPNNNGASDNSPADHAATHDSPAPEHDPVSGSGDDLFAHDSFRQLLPGRGVLFERRPRPQRHNGKWRGHRLPGQQRVALGTCVIVP